MYRPVPGTWLIYTETERHDHYVREEFSEMDQINSPLLNANRFRLNLKCTSFRSDVSHGGGVKRRD